MILSALAVSLCVSLLLVLTKPWHGHMTLDTVSGVQKIHQQPTPRVGGLAIASGLLVGWSLAPDDVADITGTLLLAGLPAFAAGLVEDVTKKIGVYTRLLATMASGVLAWWLTGVALNRVDIPLADMLLAWTPLAVLFTAFAVAGVANAINIIDGFNGLSSGTLMVMLAALGTIAGMEGDTALASTCLLLGASVFGFWLVNFPLGKLFLGDGGAYLSGFALAWIGVLLITRNPHVTPWLVLLACAYPVLEVLYTIWRRLRSKRPPGAPDNLHLHSLIKTQVIRKHVPHWPAPLRNAAVSPFIWAYAALPGALAVWFENSFAYTQVLALGLYVMGYHLTYCRLARSARADAVTKRRQKAVATPADAAGPMTLPPRYGPANSGK